jgi:hypothetical protein
MEAFYFHKVNTNNSSFVDYLITHNEEPYIFETKYCNVRKTETTLNLILPQSFVCEMNNFEIKLLDKFRKEYPIEKGYISSFISSSSSVHWIPIENYQDISFYNEKKEYVKYPLYTDINQMRVIFQVKKIRVYKNSSIRLIVEPLQIQYKENFNNDMKLSEYAFSD